MERSPGHEEEMKMQVVWNGMGINKKLEQTSEGNRARGGRIDGEKQLLCALCSVLHNTSCHLVHKR